MSEINHEAAKKVAIAGSSHGNATSHGVVCMAYLDMVAQRDSLATGNLEAQHRAAQENSKLREQLTAIMEGRDNG